MESTARARRIEDFTLIVPTYKRPADLARLLRYCARHPARFPILVLDSGDVESRAANAALVASLDLDVTLRTFGQAITPFEKFWRGSEAVTTEFAAFCADDDVVLVGALPSLLAFLQAHADFGAAHGWYWSFDYQPSRLAVTGITYASPSLDGDDPLLRLRDLLARYEALTYAVYRTEAMRQALREAQPVPSLMARELLAGALTVINGKVARLPLLYYGRSLAPSVGYHHWHPVDFLISSPEQLFAQYAQYRRIVFDALRKTGYEQVAPDELLKLIDLIHLRYLAEYVTPDRVAYLIDELMAGTGRDQILRGFWPRLAPSASPLVNLLRQSKGLRALRDRIAPGFRLRQVARLLGALDEQTVTATTVGGHAREYRLQKEFLDAVPGASGVRARDAVESAIAALNAYE